jgi:hypothetical protein
MFALSTKEQVKEFFQPIVERIYERSDFLLTVTPHVSWKFRDFDTSHPNVQMVYPSTHTHIKTLYFGNIQGIIKDEVGGDGDGMIVGYIDNVNKMGGPAVTIAPVFSIDAHRKGATINNGDIMGLPFQFTNVFFNHLYITGSGRYQECFSFIGWKIDMQFR